MRLTIVESDWTRWQDYWQALQSNMSYVQDQIEAQVGAATPGEQKRAARRLGKLLTYLQTYAAERFCFFYDGFHPTTSYLEPSTCCQPAFILQTLLNKITTDVRICNGRWSSRLICDIGARCIVVRH